MNSFPYQPIVVAIPWFSEHDAMSNDAYWQKRFFSENGVSAYLYAEGHSPHLKNQLITYSECKKLLEDPKSLLIYHHGVYWAQGDEILKNAAGKICLKYHNITPPEFYRGYDRASTFATEKGREQTSRIIESERIALYMGASEFNIEDLKSYKKQLSAAAAVAPFTQVNEFEDVAEDQAIADSLTRSGRFNVLFVGRVVPNKGHVHLLRVIDRYIDMYGLGVHLNIVGGLALGENTYFIELENEVERRGLSENVSFHQKVGSAGLKAFYRNSDVFLLMSEHEGFCVPILEAQYFNLPILALDRAAVRETLGEGQFIFSELDYDFFACALRRFETDETLKNSIRRNGLVNFNRFHPQIIFKKTLECLSQI